MRRFAAVLVLALAGCGSSSPTAPPPPRPPVFERMTGGWIGVASTTWVTSLGPGARACNETWVVTSQTAGDFSGTYQSSPGTDAICSDGGNISGTILSDGTVQSIHHTGGAATGSCTFVGGDLDYRGFVNGAGITAQKRFTGRCPYGRTVLSYDVTITLTMNRR